MKRFYLENLGCSKNASDGEVVIGSLVERGYHWTQDPGSAEIIILNTCGFIEEAVRESLDRLLELADYKLEGNCKKLVMMGCVSQRYQRKLDRELPEVDLFVGTGYLREMPDVLNSSERFFFERRDTPILSGNRPELHLPVSYIKIAEGCDNRCTYCLIPSLRGTMRSRSIDDIVREAEGALRQGAKELILIAQDVSRFGRDRTESLEELLLALNAIPGKFWIRLQYVYTDILTRSFFETLASCEKVLPYLDMPIQHISDRVLKRMNRHTTRRDIERVISWARELVPDIALRSTVMVGFPGETEEDFEELMCFLDEYPFERLGAFIYSDEEGIASKKLKDKVPSEIKQERFERLMSAQIDRAEEWSANKVGEVIEVLVEEYGMDGVYARSRWDAPEVDCIVFVKDTDVPVGTFLSVLITESEGMDLNGVIYESAK